MTTHATITKPEYPKWIDGIEQRLRNIQLDTFPTPVWIEWNIVKPENNKYCGKWAVSVHSLMEVKDRDNPNKQLTLQNISQDGLYLYKNDNVEQIVCADIEQLVSHEIKECFRINRDNKSELIFDPHDVKTAVIACTARDKVMFYRFYPSYILAWSMEFSRYFHALDCQIIDRISHLIKHRRWLTLTTLTMCSCLMLITWMYVTLSLLM